MGGRKVQTGLSPVLEPRLVNDAESDRVARSHARAIGELQKLPAVGMRVIAGVELADGVDTPIAHGLGRAPVFVRESSPRNPSTSGRVEEVRSAGYDRGDVVVLRATGWGATITVDVLAF